MTSYIRAGLGVHRVEASDPGDDWRTRAVCRDEDPELFFPIGSGEPALRQEKAAQEVCRRCPVQNECGAWAVESHQLSGVWGAMSERQLRAAVRRRRPGTNRGAQLQPCGTSAAYQRHRRAGEQPCQPCQQARAADLAARNAAKKQGAST